MRTYAVILPPDDVRADVARALTEVGPLAPGVSWRPSDRLQVRLAYFGNLGQMETAAVRSTLTQITAALATFESAAWIADEMTLVRMLPGGADVPDVWEQVERYPFTATADAQ
jgi:hypothetical protein